MEDKVFCPLMGEKIDVAICFDICMVVDDARRSGQLRRRPLLLMTMRRYVPSVRTIETIKTG